MNIDLLRKILANNEASAAATKAAREITVKAAFDSCWQIRRLDARIAVQKPG
jgi:hypothetical protein